MLLSPDVDASAFFLTKFCVAAVEIGSTGVLGTQAGKREGDHCLLGPRNWIK